MPDSVSLLQAEKSEKERVKELLVPETSHILFNSDSRQMSGIPDQTVDLVLTSPPYPMVEMWDGLFQAWDSNVSDSLSEPDGDSAFEYMHLQLDKVWTECYRVLKEGGILLINIGDATRSIGGEFRLYSNHSRILQACRKLGFNTLPDILWRKQTNSPTKFMGSGMFPVGAYVTYEHEYILIFRKGGLRKFSKKEVEIRRNSAFFWEERNKWFSDVWEIKGERQIFKDVGASRERSAAFPLEFAYRLINMFSIKGDMVLDPFLGTGTTSLAAVLGCRSSIGFDIDRGILDIARKRLLGVEEIGAKLIENRLQDHFEFILERNRTRKSPGHLNRVYNIPVITSQERSLSFELVSEVQEAAELSVNAKYSHYEIK